MQGISHLEAPSLSGEGDINLVTTATSGKPEYIVKDSSTRESHLQQVENLRDQDQRSSGALLQDEYSL
jgi:hypothetical protein